MDSTIVQQNIITDSRLKLRNVYSDNRFIEIFKSNLTIPYFQVNYDQTNFIITITIDKNRCMDIMQGFEHKKEYYGAILHKIIMNSLYEFVSILDMRNVEDYNLWRSTGLILSKCLNKEICSYKLYDTTTILDNIINIYL